MLIKNFGTSNMKSKFDVDLIFRNASHFEWFNVGYSIFGNHLKKFIPLSSKVLVIGCGSSGKMQYLVFKDSLDLGEKMLGDGFEQKITNIDYSEKIIQHLSDNNTNPKLECLTDSILLLIQKDKVMDATNMRDFEDESFDAAIDKGFLVTLFYNLKVHLTQLWYELCTKFSC